RKKLEEKGEPFVMAVLPDHQTPLYLRSHVGAPVPFIVYNSLHPAKCGLTYSERTAEKGIFLDNGRALIKMMTKE
ncbi:MAG: phosphoglycerate mutase, partial [Clostridia bacterium]|nr:phosphoglycerate mutase [Clostridia bacterium]